MSTADSLVLTHDWLFGLLEVGLPGLSLEQRRAPALSPMLNELSGLPPALFTVGDLDPLRDDSILMATRWQLSGNHADVDLWPEAGHAFINMATPLGELALERTTTWLDENPQIAMIWGTGSTHTIVTEHARKVCSDSRRVSTAGMHSSRRTSSRAAA